MRSVGVFEAKNRLTSLLKEVEDGGEIIITRRGKPIARLASLEAGFNRATARATAEGLREVSKGLILGGLTLKTLIKGGRQ